MRGYISAQIKSDGEIGDDGLPVFDSVEWGELVKCKFIPNSYEERKVYADGKFTDMAFTITTSDMSFEAEIIRLYDSRKKTSQIPPSLAALRLKPFVKSLA